MKHDNVLKEKAIELRRKGFSYRGILKEVRVAKSTLSRCLKNLPLTHEERLYLNKERCEY